MKALALIALSVVISSGYAISNQQIFQMQISEGGVNSFGHDKNHPAQQHGRYEPNTGYVFICGAVKNGNKAYGRANATLKTTAFKKAEGLCQTPGVYQHFIGGTPRAQSQNCTANIHCISRQTTRNVYGTQNHRYPDREYKAAPYQQRPVQHPQYPTYYPKRTSPSY